MKQTKSSKCKINPPSLFRSLLTLKKSSFVYKVYYKILSFKALYKYKRTLKYSVIGLAGEIIDVSFLLLFTEIFNIYYLFSAFFSNIIAISHNFLFNLTFTFKYRPRNLTDLLSSYLGYFSISFFSLFLNISLIGVLVELFSFNYIIAKLISTFCLFILGYFGHSFIFKGKN